MAGLPAARVADPHVCTAHGGGPVLPPGTPLVLVGGMPAATATGQAFCAGPVDFIVTGATMVLIGNKLAARATDKTAHGGIVAFGDPMVLIGGPTGGATLGNTAAGTAACNAAAAGRSPPPGTLNTSGNPVPSGTTQQSYNNCGVESSRQIINQVSPPGQTQEQLLNWAESTPADGPRGWFGEKLATTDPRGQYESGGTYPYSQQQILQKNGVPASEEDPTMGNVAQAAAEGRGVIVNMDAFQLWGPPNKPGAWHAVLVTGVQYDANGNITNVIINDTGNLPPNNCGMSYPVGKIQQGMKDHGGNIVVTNNPIW
jgi:uncharacterized Zn-binding protein involved in type VI secretion